MDKVDIPSFASALTQHPAPFKPFLPLLKASQNVEDALPLLTSSVLSKLLSYAITHSTKGASQIDEALPQIYTYLSKLATSSDSALQDIAVQEYSSLLRDKTSRQLFWKQRSETLDPLFSILRTASGASKDQDSLLWSGGSSIRSSTEVAIGGGVGLQLLYHVLLVIWQLSFEGELVGDGLQEYDLDFVYCVYHAVLLIISLANTTSSSSMHISSVSLPKRRRHASSFLRS
jgi:V-type H+-transporting ATPase subunit H